MKLVGEKIINSKKNIVFSTISMVISVMMGILIPRIAIVGYGSEVNGLLTSAIQFISYLSLFEAGIQSVATKSLYKPVGESNVKQINAILSAVNKSYKKIGSLYFIALVLLSLVFPMITRTTIDYFTVVIVVFFSGLGNVISFFVQGKYKILMIVEGKNYVITNINTFVTIGCNAVKIIFLALGIRIPLVIFVSFLISLLQTALIHRYIKRNYLWIDLHVEPDTKALKNNFAALIHQIATLIFSNTDVVLLTAFCGLESVSVYSIYKLIFSYLMNIIQIPFISCNFAMGQLFYKDIKKYGEYLDSLNVCMGWICCSVFTVTYILILPFIDLYTSGADINYVSKSIAVLFLIMEMLNAFRIPNVSTINIAGHYKETVWHAIIETGINIVSSIVLVNVLGIEGVILGSIFALAYRTVDIWIYTDKKILYRRSIKTFFIYFTNVMLSIFVLYVCKNISITIVNYGTFACWGLGLVTTIVPLFLIMNCLLFRKECNEVFRIVKLSFYGRKA